MSLHRLQLKSGCQTKLLFLFLELDENLVGREQANRTVTATLVNGSHGNDRLVNIGRCSNGTTHL